MLLRLLALIGLLGALGACAGHEAQPRDATVALDFTPNAVHAGIYSAVALGFDRTNHVRLHVLVPSASTASIKLLESGRANFAILDIHDLAIAREQGAAIVGIMAVVERPLAAVIAAPRIANPRELAGRPIGITGVPSDSAVVRSVVAGAGGDPRRLRTITIGFNAVADLLAGRVAGATAFWNDEGVTLERRRPGFHSFRVDDFGAPAYPELVLCTTATTLRHEPALAGAVVRTLRMGYAFTLAHPARSARQLEALVPGLDPTLVAAELSALLPAFTPARGQVGELDRATLTRWAAWERRFGIVSRAPSISQTFDSRFVSSG